MLKIKREDLRDISYDEFGRLVESLTSQIREFCTARGVKFHLVVPILRGGAFTGMHIATKLGIKNVLPTQYKYHFHPREYNERKFDFPELTYELPETINILIVDSKTVYGGTMKKVKTDVSEAYPKAKLYFASLDLDQSITNVDGIEHIFAARISNERRALSREEAQERSISNDILVFPWENIDDMWREIQGSDKYNS